mgnify:CR=1 FL=1
MPIILDDTNETQNQPTAQQVVQPPKIFFNYMDDYLDNRFDAELADFQQYKDRKTGFPNIDEIQSLYPGLYVVGGISSLGKTTFVHQMADQIAASGQPVLYFSMEQSVMELTTKSLARQIYLHHLRVDSTYHPYTSIEIRNGEAAGTRELVEQRAEYKAKVKGNMCVVQCNHELTVEFLISSVTEYMKQYGVKPTIVVDYLQIMSPSTVNGRPLTDTKTNIDHVVHALKAFQMSNSLTIIAICSLNRANYLTPVDFESFKESGGIEYTADSVWGLQLSILDEDEFYYKDSPTKNGKLVETTDKEKRAMVKEEKAMSPRRIQLSVMKNRYGKPNYSVNFEYEGQYDTFIAVDENGYYYGPNGGRTPGSILQAKAEKNKERAEAARAQQEDLEKPDPEQEDDAIRSQKKALTGGADVNSFMVDSFLSKNKR